MSGRPAALLLEDMYEAIEKIERFLCGLDRDAFLQDDRTVDAVVRNLVPSITVYMRWGKGPKRRLRFTKSGDSNLEAAYATHFVSPGHGAFRPSPPKGIRT